MKLTKILIIFLAIFYCNKSFAQKIPIIPRFGVFELLRTEYNKFDSLLQKNDKSPLNREELKMLVESSNALKELIDTRWQQQIYVGYLKRVEANICFHVVSVLKSTQRYKDGDKVFLKQLLDLLKEGIDDLHKYPPSQYPQYIITDEDYTHPSENEIHIATRKMIIEIDEMWAYRLMAILNEKLGNVDDAINDAYTAYEQRGNITSRLLEQSSGELDESTYSLANNIFNACNTYKKYDQRFWNFCLGLRDYKRFFYEAQKGLEAIAALENSNLKIHAVFDNPDEIKNKDFDWLLLLLYKLDSKNMLIPQNQDLNDFKYPTRAYLDMVHYAMERINANATGEVLIAATAIANKHFNDAIELIKIWSKNNTDCDRIKWASGNMDKVNTDEENKKWITKKMKKCGKEQKNSFYKTY